MARFLVSYGIALMSCAVLGMGGSLAWYFGCFLAGAGVAYKFGYRDGRSR